MEIRQKILIPRPILEADSRSSESTPINRLPMIHSNHRPVLYRFQDKKLSLQISPLGNLLTALAGAQKLEWSNYQTIKKCDVHLFTMHMYWHDRTSIGRVDTVEQTDGWNAKTT